MFKLCRLHGGSAWVKVHACTNFEAGRQNDSGVPPRHQSTVAEVVYGLLLSHMACESQAPQDRVPFTQPVTPKSDSPALG